tara:strand:- start:1005 stop:2414 length:1410 start_codon:yes stop_codon:yes gene_type:complete
MLHGYDDPIKQASREKLKDFIEKHLLTRKRPKDIKVLCFPGAEREGEEALEVKLIYDQLGIPRSNITGLEYGKEQYQRLLRADLGINVVNKSDLEYLVEANSPFDVISFDYTGQKGIKLVYAVATIKNNWLLKAGGIFAVNNYAGREQAMTQRILKGTAEMSLEASNIVRKGEMLKQFFKMPLRYIVKEKFSGVELSKARDMFTISLINAFMGSTLNWNDTKFREGYHTDRIYGAYPNAKEFELEDRKKIDKQFWMPKQLKEMKIRMKHETRFREHIYDCVYGTLMRGGVELNDYYVDNKVGLGANLQMGFNKAYYVKNMKRYSYISNKGHRMEMDLFSLYHNKRMLERLRPYLRFDTIDGHKEFVATKEYQNNTKRAWKKVRAPLKELTRGENVMNAAQLLAGVFGQASVDLPKRVHLGSSYIPREKKERINEDDALILLAGGSTPQEINEVFGGISVKRLKKLERSL